MPIAKLRLAFEGCLLGRNYAGLIFQVTTCTPLGGHSALRGCARIFTGVVNVEPASSSPRIDVVESRDSDQNTLAGYGVSDLH